MVRRRWKSTRGCMRRISNRSRRLMVVSISAAMVLQEPISAAAIHTTLLVRLARATGRSTTETLAKAATRMAAAAADNTAAVMVGRQSLQRRPAGGDDTAGGSPMGRSAIGCMSLEGRLATAHPSPFSRPFPPPQDAGDPVGLAHGSG